MVLEVTLIQNSKINIVTKFQVSIFKNDEFRGGGTNLPPPTRNKLAQRQRGIGLKSVQNIALLRLVNLVKKKQFIDPLISDQNVE
jgi:hypothetical protein